MGSSELGLIADSLKGPKKFHKSSSKQMQRTTTTFEISTKQPTVSHLPKQKKIVDANLLI